MHSLKIKHERVPLYETVTQHLRDEIEDGVFENDERLPSEGQLAKLFGVSRTTVREALSVLEQQGRVRRVHGVGTWITHNSNQMPIGTGMERIMSYTDYIRIFGYEPGTRIIDFEWLAATAKHKAQFERDDLTKVGVLKRVRTADSDPLLLCYDIMPPEVIGGDFEPRYLGESLFDYITARNVTLSSSELSITAVNSDTTLSHDLEVEEGEPLLMIDDRYFNHKGNVVLVSRNFYRVDRWVLRIYRNEHNA